MIKFTQKSLKIKWLLGLLAILPATSSMASYQHYDKGGYQHYYKGGYQHHYKGGHHRSKRRCE